MEESLLQETTRQLSCKAKYLGTSTIYVGTAGKACKLGTKLYLIICTTYFTILSDEPKCFV